MRDFGLLVLLAGFLWVREGYVADYQLFLYNLVLSPLIAAFYYCLRRLQESLAWLTHLIFIISNGKHPE